MSEPVSAEDRATKALNAFLLDAEGVEIFNGPEVSKLLSSEGLAVVAQEDVLTPAQSVALLYAMDISNPSWKVRYDTPELRSVLRRLSGADQG